MTQSHDMPAGPGNVPDPQPGPAVPYDAVDEMALAIARGSASAGGWSSDGWGATAADSSGGRLFGRLSLGRIRVGAPALSAGSSGPVAVVLSFLWPGLGQLYLKRRLSAAIFGVPVLLVFIWLALTLLRDTGLYFALSMVDRNFAMAMVVGTIGMGLWRLASMVHAWWIAGNRHQIRIIDSGVLALLLVVVFAAHSVVAYYAYSAYDFDVTLANNQLVQPSGSPSADAPTAPVETPSATPTLEPTASQEVTPSANPTPEVHKSHHLTIMLAGLDWLPGRRGGQYDALMLVSIDTNSHKVVMTSFPRDTANFDFYWGKGRAGVNTKINNFANLVERRQIKAPDTNKFVALGNELGYLAGIKVDYYAVIDMQGFINLVDSAGKVCLNVPRAVMDKSQNTFIGAGYQCMSGKTALKYARSRHGTNDYSRAGRQQQLIEALARKIASPSGIGRLPRLLSLASKIVQTNFPLNTAKDYASLIRQVGPKDVTQCVLGPPFSYHPATSLTKGNWTARLKMYNVAAVSVWLYGDDSRYYGMEGVVPMACPHQ